MDQKSLLGWKVDFVELGNIQRNAYSKLFRIAVKIPEIKFHLVNGTPAVNFVLQFNFVSLEIKYDAGLRLSEAADTIELIAKEILIDCCLRCKV